MRKMIVIALLIVILLNLVSSKYCVCLYKGPCGCEEQSYRSKNMTQIVDYEQKSRTHWSGSDEAFGAGFDTFEDTRPDFSSWEKQIEIKLESNACLNENIVVRTYYANKPLANTLVKLYSHGGGRAYISEITTNEQGFGVFKDRPVGKYDFVAKKDGYNFGQTMFTVDECLAQPKQMQKTEQNTETGVVKEEIVAVVYAQEYERKYIDIQIGATKKATRVVLEVYQNENDTHDKNTFVVERIPMSIITDVKKVGFEEKYPQFLGYENESVVIRWKLEKNVSKYEYVLIDRPYLDSIDDIEVSIENENDEQEPKSKTIFETILGFFGI